MTPPSRVRARLADVAALHAIVSERMSDEIVALAERVRTCLDSDGVVYFCGNGGSAADAQHLAAEYVVRLDRDRAPLRAVALTTDTSILSAAGNDWGFEAVFERQVEALGRSGDLLVMHSTSGESENLIRAADAAQRKGMGTAALLAKGGGRLADRVDLALVVPTNSTSRAQEVHLLIGHLVCELVEEWLAPPRDPSEVTATEDTWD